MDEINTKSGGKMKIPFFLTVLLILFSFQTCSVLIKSHDEDGILYVWNDKDVLKDVAAKYSVDPLELKRLNDIYDEKDLSSGTVLFVPGKYLPSPEDIKQAELHPSLKKPLDKSAVNPSKTRNGYLWPAWGSISSRFGPRGSRMHYGIDIRSNHGLDIFAIQNGVVEFAGNRRSFGKIVIINHYKDYRALYAHNSKIFVKKGDRVKRGQKIAKMGQSGRATGVHLHFELHYKNKPVDPLRYLPR